MSRRHSSQLAGESRQRSQNKNPRKQTQAEQARQLNANTTRNAVVTVGFSVGSDPTVLASNFAWDYPTSHLVSCCRCRSPQRRGDLHWLLGRRPVIAVTAWSDRVVPCRRPRHSHVVTVLPSFP
ncbi:hypothetical protein PIB30_044184 [Stylosanthes scabra]|uniref:Uncharacterized protein n=1 Tax=Stylosanthes scabra TaxID=79078 RepID=A0ABU6ZEI0_9FABA|nr:hypothetical protein [Stylosanthes scabra]